MKLPKEKLAQVEALTDKLNEFVLANAEDKSVGEILAALAYLVVHGVSAQSDEEADTVLEAFFDLIRKLNAGERKEVEK